MMFHQADTRLALYEGDLRAVEAHALTDILLPALLDALDRASESVTSATGEVGCLQQELARERLLVRLANILVVNTDHERQDVIRPAWFKNQDLMQQIINGK